ncbi:MAG: hypothetical protein ACRDOU_19135, partial [Streptosporangiaceae bacterium]
TDFPHIRPSVTGMLASVAPRLRQATVTCSYPDQVTIYNCRISERRVAAEVRDAGSHSHR